MQRIPFGRQPVEESSDPPATAVDGHRRQARFMLHVVSERFDLLRVGRERSGVLWQTPDELEPSDGKPIEPGLAGQLAFNTGESQGLSGSVGQANHLRNRKQITGVLPQANRE